MGSLFPLLSPLRPIPLTLSQSLLFQLDNPLRQQGHRARWTVYKEWGSVSLSLSHPSPINLSAHPICQEWRHTVIKISDLAKNLETDSLGLSSVLNCHFFPTKHCGASVPVCPASFTLSSLNSLMERPLQMCRGWQLWQMQPRCLWLQLPAEPRTRLTQ